MCEKKSNKIECVYVCGKQYRRVKINGKTWYFVRDIVKNLQILPSDIDCLPLKHSTFLSGKISKSILAVDSFGFVYLRQCSRVRAKRSASYQQWLIEKYFKVSFVKAYV